VLKMYIQNAYTILVITANNHIKWSSKRGFGLITSNHTTPRHTVHDLDNVLHNTLTTYFNMTYSLERQDTADR
jgi:hypothetical protein